THTDADADLSCDACGCFVDEAVTGWLFNDVPTYKGGSLSTALYLAGQGIDAAQLAENENTMQTVSNTTASEFSAYLSKLERAGYQKEFSRSADGNLFASYVSEHVRVYAYFMGGTGEARIVREYTKNSAALADFGYTYEKKTGEQTVLYQFALAMNDETHAKPDFKDNGMLYMIKLADNSVVIVDGANSIQMTNERRDELMQMLWDITGSQEGDTVRVAGWYITHAHGDHYGGFLRFTWKYAKYIDLERVFFGLPSLNSSNEVFSTGSGADGYRQIIEIATESYADDEPLFLRLHTGQSFSLADVSFEVLQTPEDLVDPVTGQSLITNYNNASSVVRLTVDGQSFLFLGDADKQAMNCMLANWSDAYLRSDGVQLAHHVMNDLSTLYHVVQASVLFVPQSQYGINVADKRMAAFEAAKTYARTDMIFLQNEQTVGIAAVNGKWEKVYAQPFTY
ncbi:MAG: hypothetical protein IKZ16_08885, partial [Clostridia bacterium]|nr:hypothetical protein [Clostridia bacterium]